MTTGVLKWIISGPRGDNGQTLIEYILVIVLIAIVLILAFRSGNIKEAVGERSDSIADMIANKQG